MQKLEGIVQVYPQVEDSNLLQLVQLKYSCFLHMLATTARTRYCRFNHSLLHQVISQTKQTRRPFSMPTQGSIRIRVPIFA